MTVALSKPPAKASSRGRRALPLLLVAAASLSLVSCEAIKNLTKPDSSPTQVITLSANADSVPTGGGDIEFVATVVLGGAPESGVRVNFETTAGEFDPSDSVLTDANGQARATLHTTSEATVTAKLMAGGVAVVASGSVTVGVGGSSSESSGDFTIAVSHTPTEIEADEPVTFLVEARRKDNNNKVPGKLEIEFGDGNSAKLTTFDGKDQIEHVYREESFFNLQVTVTATGGSKATGTFGIDVVDSTETGIQLSASSDELPARETFELTVEISRDNGKQGSGKVSIDWGDGRATNVGDIKGKTKVEHIYRDKGSFRIQAEVKDDRGKSARASYRIRVGDPLSIAGGLSASDTSPAVGESVAFTFSATRNDGKNSSGSASVDFGDGSGTTASVSGSRATFSHAYAAEGGYNVSVNFDDGDGHTAKATLRIDVSNSSGGGSGGGGGGGDSGGGGGGSSADELDPGSIVFLHANAGNWNVSSTVTSVKVSTTEICIHHTKSGGWPVLDGAEGNPSVVANVGGTWYSATYEWNRPGQDCKDLGVPGSAPDTAHSVGPHTKASPLSGWVPKKGEVVYFFASTHARAGFSTIDERSNIVKVIWPY